MISILITALFVSAAPAPGPVKVMSFNIRNGKAKDGENNWSPNRKNINFQVYKTHLPSVFGLQEAFKFQTDEISGQLPDYGHVYVSRDKPPNPFEKIFGLNDGEGCPIFWDKRVYNLKSTETFWLSDTPGKVGSISPTWGNKLARISTRVSLDPVNPGTPSLVVFNVHMDHDSEIARQRSATLLCERAHPFVSTGRNVIIMGDFNAGPDSAAAKIIRECGFDDTFKGPAVGTFHSRFDGQAQGKIDFIFASKNFAAQSSNAVVIKDNTNGRYPSDHFPISVQF